MKRQLIVILIFVLGLNSYSQIDSNKNILSPQFDKKYIVWVSPSKATHTYGFMFNFWPRTDIYDDGIYPEIFGAEINLNPIGLFFPIMLVVHSLDPETHKPPYEVLDSINFKKFKIVNGIQIGLINMESSIINGLDINLSGSFDSKSNGVTISCVMNKHHIVNGLTLAIIGNHDSKCNGVQIGLINSSKQLKGVQIGLWNKNQKRSFPIINWCFKTN